MGGMGVRGSVGNFKKQPFRKKESGCELANFVRVQSRKRKKKIQSEATRKLGSSGYGEMPNFACS